MVADRSRHSQRLGRHRREALVAKGSVGGGRIIALDGEAGYQADLLRGGLHFGFWRWQYRVHKVPLVTIPQGKIGYVYARDGEPLPPSQTLGRVVACNNFQDARAFLGEPVTKPSAASAAGSARSCAKASTPSTRPCSSSSPRTRVYTLAAACSTIAGGERGRSVARAAARSATASTPS